MLAIRTNDLATKRYLLQGVNYVRELRVPDLSDDDINAILATLEAQGLLGELRNLEHTRRVHIFRTKAKKQILVAMREATRGKGFDEIIQDEYAAIAPASAKLLYLIAAIPTMYHSSIERGQLIAAT